MVVMLRPTRNRVVNRSSVGKTEKSSTVRTYMVIIRMVKDRAMFTPMSVSTTGRGQRDDHQRDDGDEQEDDVDVVVAA